MEYMHMILAENERLKNGRITRLKRRMRNNKYQQQQLTIMLQMELTKISLSFVEKLSREIKVDFGKIYMTPKVTNNTWENMLENFTVEQLFKTSG